MVFEFAPHAVPYLTAAQMAEVDRIAVGRYRIALLQMMENAGRGLARLACDRFLDGDPRGKRAVVLAGAGGNGGGVLAAARHLHNWGASIEVVLAQPARAMKPAPKRQLAILRRMGVAFRDAPDASGRSGLVIDGLVGYSLRGAPSGNVAGLIRWANGTGAPVLAMDVPSGLDATTGVAFDPAIEAAATLTLALPKTGLLAAGAAPYAGELYLADIGIPPALYAQPEIALDVGPLFARGEVIRLR